MKEVIQKINELMISYRKRYLRVNKNGEWKTYDKKIYPSTRPLSDWMIQEHINGKVTYGVMGSENHVKFICFDIDFKDEMSLAKWATYKVVDCLIELGIYSKDIHISFSGNKGYHIDIYFTYPIKIKVAKKFYSLILDLTELPKEKVEFRPDGLTYGVKLPLGVHPQTKKRCWYVDSQLKPIEDINHILKIEQIDPKIIFDILEKDNVGKMSENDNDNNDNIKQVKNKIENKVRKLDIYNVDIDPEETVAYIENLLIKGLQIKGSRHKSLVKIGKYFRYKGFSLDEASEMLKEWMLQQDKKMYTTDLKSALKDAEEVINWIYKNEVGLTMNKKDLSVTLSEMERIMKLETLNQKILTYCLLLHSKRYANDQGIFYMTYKQMTEASNFSEKTTRNLINKIEEEGVLTVIERKRSISYTERKPNLYKLEISNADSVTDKKFKISIEDTMYSMSFNSCVNFLFNKDELKDMLPRRQYQSITK